MAKDFKASQIRTSKIIVSGTESGKPALLIYSASDASNFAGGIPTSMLSNVGSDVYLFVSGNNNSVISGNRARVTLFGGDVVVSGTFFAEKMVSEVSTTVNSDHFISGGIFLSEKASDPSNASVADSMNQIALYAKDDSGVTRLYFKNSEGVTEIGLQPTGTFNVPQPSKFVTTASLSLAGDLGFTHTGGTDAYLFVSGTRTGKNVGLKSNVGNSGTRKFSVFGGDAIVSGNLGSDQTVYSMKNIVVAQSNSTIAGGFARKSFGGSSPSLVIFTSGTQNSGEGLVFQGYRASGGSMGSFDFAKFTGDGSSGFGGVKRFDILMKETSVDTAGMEPRVTFLSGGASTSTDEAAGTDVGFYVSGALNSKGLTTKGTSIFGGDVVVSGSLYATNGSIEVQSVADKGDKFTISVGSNGDTTISTIDNAADNAHLTLQPDGEIRLKNSVYGRVIFGEGATDYLRVERAGSGPDDVIFKNMENGRDIVFQQFDGNENLRLTDGNQVLIHSGGGSTSPDMSNATDTNFFVSGTIGSIGTSTKGTSVFGGDVFVSGALSSGGTAIVKGTGVADRLTLWGSSDTVTSFSGLNYNTSKPALYNSGAISTGFKTNASGQYSLAQSYGTLASGPYSHAEGHFSTSSGNYAHAEGKYTLADGSRSHAEGFGTKTTGLQAHSEGLYTTASGNSSHAEGGYTNSTSNYSHAEGFKTLSSNDASHSEGYFTTASAAYAHAEGANTLANNLGSHAEGQFTTASGQYSHAEGYYTLATSNHSHAEGERTLASAGYSHTEGLLTTGSGLYSHAEGLSTIAAGSYAHAEGRSNLASGDYAHSEGMFTTASGEAASSAGQSTIAFGNYSHAGGMFTIASGSGQTVVGQYNARGNTTSLFVVGVGGHEGDRKDAFLVNTSSAGYSVHVGTGSSTKLIVDESGKVGVGIENPLGQVHVKSGDSGATPNSFSDDLVIEGSDSTGISILTPNNSVGRIYFGDSDNNQRGYLLYDHNTDLMKFSVANGNRLIIDQGGISGSLTKLVDGNDYLRAGTNITLLTGSDGSVTITASGGVDVTSGGASNRLSFFTDSDSIAGDAELQYNPTLNTLYLSGNISQGLQTLTSNNYSHAEGHLTTASALYSHAEGDLTVASGYGSHAEGDQTTASDTAAHAEGGSTVASSVYSHAEGFQTTATNHHAHAEGRKTLASGMGSHTEGYFTTASGNYSHAEGQYSVALGSYSHAGGQYSIASGTAQTVLGQYNKEGNTDSLFVVGVGGHAGDRTDAFLVNSGSTGYSVRVGTDSDTRLIVNEAGNVGIGTSSPQNPFHIVSNTGDAVKIDRAGGVNVLLRNTSAGTGFQMTNAGAYGQFSHGGTATMNLKGGKVGIGTTDPTHALSVVGALSASLGLSGSLTRLVDGTSYLKAGSGVTITSSSNGSVTISTAGGGAITSVSGSTSVGSVTQIDFTEAGILNDNGGGVAALTGTIGNPEDGSYADGLFTSFTSATTIGTAIDKINEVLKFLAPSPAQNVNDINADSAQGAAALLSFGVSSGLLPTAYNIVPTPMPSGNTLSSVDVNGSFQVVTGSGGDLRLAVYNSATTVSGIINSKINQSDYDGGSVINHVADSFGDADKGSLALEVNGSDIVTVNLSLSTVGTGVPGSGTGTHFGVAPHGSTGIIQLSQTGSARTQSDTEFPVFQHRTGKFTISSDSQRKGYNYAKIKHTVGSSTYTTNFVEWVYDSDGTDTDTPISANDTTLNFDALAGGTNIFPLSGVKYAVTSSGEYRARIENYYKNVYAANAISTSITNSSIASTSPSTVPSIDHAGGENHTKSIHVTSSFDTNVSSMLGTTLTADISVAHPTKTGLSFAGSTTSGRMLIYSSSVTSTNLSETFDHEQYRMGSGSFDNQTDVTGGSFDWDPLVHMTGSNRHSDGLQFFNGALKAPVQTLNSGDFRSNADGGTFFGNGLVYNTQPDYSSITSGIRTLYRKVQNNTGAAIRDFKIQLNVGNTTIPTIVSQGTSLDTQKVKIFAKLPGEPASAWLDLGSQFTYHTTSNRSGGRANTTLNTGGSPINFFTFGTGSVANGEYFMIKIEADASLERDVGGITFTLPGIAGTTQLSPDLDAIDLTPAGTAGNLSFGASSGISGYTNVGAGANSYGSVDANSEFTSQAAGTENRFGILNGSTAITGTLNFDVGANGNNYPADSFGKAHLGTIALEVNGAVIHTLDLTNVVFSGDSKTGDSGFANISTAKNATGSDGLVADYTKFWRTGNYVISPGSQVNGWNYARIIRNDGSTINSNYVEWVNDSDGDALSVSNATFSPFGESSETYYQSGVKYFTQPTGSFRAQASHAYSNVYSSEADAVKITSVSNFNNVTFTQITGSGILNSHASSNQMLLPDLDLTTTTPEDGIIFVTGAIAFNQATSLPGSSPLAGTNYAGAAQIDVKHPLNGTQSSGNVFVGGSDTKKFLVFSGTVGDSNANTTERFGREDFRIISGNYTSQGAIGSGKWNSNNSINDSGLVSYYNGLLIYNGHLVSPIDNRLPGSGDFRSFFDNGASSIISPLSNVNYTSLSAASSSHRTYFRHFENNTINNVFNVDIGLFGSATIVGKSGALSGSLGANQNVHVEAKLPGKTGWLDFGKATAGSGNISDGDGGMSGDLDQSIDGSGATSTLTFNGQTVNGTGTGAEKIILKITAHKNWTGYLNRVDITY